MKQSLQTLAVLDMPQFQGNYVEEYVGAYPIYMAAFDASTGHVVTQLEMDYNDVAKTFVNASAPMSVAINKTGYLSQQDFQEATLVPVNEHSGVIDTVGDAAQPVEYFDLQGRKIADIDTASGIIIVKRADGTATKVLKK